MANKYVEGRVYKIGPSRKSDFKPGTKEYRKDRYLFHMYGITLTQYNILFNKQEGKCAICKKHQLEFELKLAVDHCHKTGKVRGLLCTACNQAIGKFEEKIENFNSAIKYLENSL